MNPTITYLETRDGLPNTCSRCGQYPGVTWYAPSTAQAIAGAGLCAKCYQPSHAPPAAPSNDESARVKQKDNIAALPDRHYRGLNDKRRAALNAAGIHTIRDLINTSADRLAEITGLSPRTTLSWLLMLEDHYA